MDDGSASALPAGWASSRLDGGNNYLCIDPTELKVGKKLGEGTFGVVYQATWQQMGAPRVEVAVKQLKTVVQLDAMLDFMKASPRRDTAIACCCSIFCPCTVKPRPVVEVI
jgi:serine/threonine protein kinase